MPSQADASRDEFNQTMGHVRSLLASQGTLDTWRELCIVLRRERPEEEQSLLLDYVESHILSWAPALSVPLHDWSRENPDPAPDVSQLLERIEAWQWSPGQPGERRGIPGLPDAYVVYIPAGTYTMGNPAADAPPAESPTTEVTISRSFWMWQTPVTQGQFRALMGYNPSYFSGPEAHPVERVTWHEAMAFCHALSTRLSLASSIELRGERLRSRALIAGPYHVNKRYLSSQGFRLPSEAEWEWACSTDGDEGVPLSERAWFSGNARGRTHPVAQKQPNARGLYDMLGHVAEWCVDQWHFTSPGGQETDPVRLGARQPDDNVLRALRGSSWYHGPEQLYPSFRDNYKAEENLAFFGFRPVKAA